VAGITVVVVACSAVAGIIVVVVVVTAMAIIIVVIVVVAVVVVVVVVVVVGIVPIRIAVILVQAATKPTATVVAIAITITTISAIGVRNVTTASMATTSGRDSSTLRLLPHVGMLLLAATIPARVVVDMCTGHGVSCPAAIAVLSGSTLSSVPKSKR